MFKKIAVALTVFLVLFSVGCNFTKTTSMTDTISLSTGSLITNLEHPVSYETLFDNENYHKFVISFSKTNFDKLVYDMQNYFDMYGTYRDNTIQQVDIYYEDGYGNKTTMNEVGFRTKGNIYTRVLPVILDEDGFVTGYQQVSFQLEFNETFAYADNSTRYKDLKDRRMFDLEQLNFKAIRSNDTAIVTEMVAYDLYQKAGIIAPNTSLGIIYFDIDGEVIPYGLFTITEAIDDVFVKEHFGKNQDGTIGDLYKCVWQAFGPATLMPNYQAEALGVSDYNEGYRKNYQLKTNKATSTFSQFENFVIDLNNTSLIGYQNKLEDILDIDSWLRTLAIGFLVGNPDDYRSNANNYYLYFYEGQAVYIPFDHDQSLGLGFYWNPYGDYGIYNDIYDYGTALSNFSDDDLVLVNNVLQFDEYRTVYENYLLEFTDPANGIFDFQMFYDEFVTATQLYQAEINRYSHLGINEFNLSSRDMPASEYYTEKSAYARLRVQFYKNQ